MYIYMGDNDKQIPILRWIGGKKRIINSIIENIPKNFNNYYEPFLGSAVVFINMSYNNKAYLNDYNKDLMNIYNLIKNEPEKLINKLEYYCKNYIHNENMDKKKEEFLINREKLNSFINIYNDDRAALYIYINKICFNGYMQFNKHNINTSSFGKVVNPKFYKEKQIYNLSHKLKNVELKNTDYKIFLKNVQKGDFIYMDPPYVPDDSTKCNIKYNKHEWTEEDYINMVLVFNELDKKGCYVMLSNSDTEFIRNNFKDKYNIKKIPIYRGLTSVYKNRAFKYELLIMNY